jgi:hypothetical protein
MGPRKLAVALLLAVLVVSSGCVGFLLGNEALSFTAEPAVTDDAAASEAGYETSGTNSSTTERTFTVAGQERQVEVTNRMTTYEKSVELPVLGEVRAGTLSLISTPAVEIGPRTFNPIGDYDNDRLVGLVESQYGGVSDTERVSSTEIRMLGTTTNVTKYAATATLQGQEVDVFIHVTKVRDGEDFVVGVGVYPQRLDGEEENVLAMLRAAEHPA